MKNRSCVLLSEVVARAKPRQFGIEVRDSSDVVPIERVFVPGRLFRRLVR